MNTPLSEFISQHQTHVEQQLTSLFAELKHCDTQLLEAMKHSLLDGGKRIRPLLCYAAAEAVGEITPATDAFASALECVHVYSLIHDDLPAMDDDDLRRGKPTCHVAYGEATAILAGDALQCLAFETLTNAPAEAEQRLAAMSTLSKASGANGMVLGQAIDLNAVNSQLTIEQLEIMHHHKTGALIKASVVMGAISAKASQNNIDALEDYAKALGLAFQVQDDILDVISDTETLGKTQGADAERNKPTYVSLLGLDAAKQKAESLRDHAIAALSPFGNRAQTLIELANYVVNRRH